MQSEILSQIRRISNILSQVPPYPPPRLRVVGEVGRGGYGFGLVQERNCLLVAVCDQAEQLISALTLCIFTTIERITKRAVLNGETCGLCVSPRFHVGLVVPVFATSSAAVLAKLIAPISMNGNMRIVSVFVCREWQIVPSFWRPVKPPAVT